MQADRKAMRRLVVEAISLAPIEVPRRATKVRVQWKSGAVSELEVPRPGRRERSHTPPHAVDRLRRLAADGLRDEEIAVCLNDEGIRTGRDRSWNEVAVKWVRRREGIARVAPDAPRAVRVPDRHADGRYSVAGVAKLFGVSRGVVRGWMQRGTVSASIEPYGQRKRIAWLTIDAAARSRISKERRRRS